MPIDALSVLCVQLTCNLLAIAKFLFYVVLCVQIYSPTVTMTECNELRGDSLCQGFDKQK